MDKSIHLIGNAHIDPVWLWRWSEGFEATRATFVSALERMDEDPDFIFTSSQAAVYEWIEHGDPSLFAKIKAKIKEGRWRIVGGWWVQPDCNIPCGESFVRQGLLGQRYFREELGVVAEVGYCVDSFGHNGMLPQILKKSGMHCYVFMRPGPRENTEIPGRLFWWESPDGSRVLTYQIPNGYTSWGERVERKLRQTAGEISHYPALMEFYGVGNHGGGPTRENLATLHRLMGDAALPPLKFSSPQEYFDEVMACGEQFPVWRNEMQHHAVGCYTAHSEIKKTNRKLEYQLLAAEKFALVADVCAGITYPKQDFTQAWKAVLFNQFHDIMAGTCIIEAYDDARSLHGVADELSSKATVFAIGGLAAKIDTRGAGEPVVVFNPSSWTREDYCEVELFGLGDTARDTARVVDADGRPVPSQIVQASAAVERTRRLRVCFPVNVDSVGYALYRIIPEPATCENTLQVGNTHLENAHLRVELDPLTGQIAALVDKKNGWQTMASTVMANVLEDHSDTWSHNLTHYSNVVGHFAGAQFKVLETGPVRVSVKAVSYYGNSKLVMVYRLYENSKWVECKAHVEWHEQHALLKLTFPVNLQDATPVFEIPYGSQERTPNGKEVPGLSWVDLSDGAHGLLLVNDSKYSYDVRDNKLSMTVLRSPWYAHHDPYRPDPDADYPYLDQGAVDVRFRLLPHRGDWREVLPHRLGEELNSPVLPVVTSVHSGDAAPRMSFLTVSADNIIVSVVKQAEDNRDVIIRCFETIGRHTVCGFKLHKPERSWQCEFSPYEIKTFRVSQDGVIETNMLEDVPNIEPVSERLDSQRLR